MPSPAAMMMRERSTVSEPVKTAATIGPTESEIATLAYQLWQDNGCPVGSDKEDWFRAEAMLKNALVAKRQDLSDVHRSPAAILPPSSKCWPSSDGGTLGGLGK
jgi:hypothetical protein